MRHLRRILLILSSAFLLSSLGSAEAERCRPAYEQAFATLATRDFRVIEKETANPSDLQLKLDVEMFAIFGSRRQTCEEGSYLFFMEKFQSYVQDAMRGPKDERSSKLRAAVSVFRQGPENIEGPPGGTEALVFRMTLASLRATAQETATTGPALRQLFEGIEQVGPPNQVRRADATATPVSTPTPNPTPNTTRPPNPPTVHPPEPRVERITAPSEPLPHWAVVSLYEIEEHAKRGEVLPILSKVQVILNWMRSVSQNPQSRRPADQ